MILFLAGWLCGVLSVLALLYWLESRPFRSQAPEWYDLGGDDDLP